MYPPACPWSSSSALACTCHGLSLPVLPALFLLPCSSCPACHCLPTLCFRLPRDGTSRSLLRCTYPYCTTSARRPSQASDGPLIREISLPESLRRLPWRTAAAAASTAPHDKSARPLKVRCGRRRGNFGALLWIGGPQRTQIRHMPKAELHALQRDCCRAL